jgi:methylmalonyl-CoA mutase N-terminal domain/subunit
MGGTQSLHTNSRDEALALPSQDSARIALRTQQILSQESGVADCVDPLGGSYCIESLTTRIENEVNAYLSKIDEMGGVLKAIEQGYIQREILASAYSYQKEIESRERIVVGLNAFTSEDARTWGFELYAPPPAIQQSQLKNLRRAKQKRNAALVEQGMGILKKALETGENLMPGMIEAVRAGATLGEVSGVLQDAFGTYTENVTI